jgi:Flp pilus assembly protein TadD/cell division protein FtsN
MRTVKLLKIAASSLVLGSAILAGLGASHAGETGAASKHSNMSRAAELAAKKAQKAIADHKVDDAVVSAERAVALMPQDPSYRFLLGEAYMAAGRFTSADSAYTDTLALSPGHERAALKLTLAKIAMGHSQDALKVLEANKASLSVADYGLAVALAGDPDAAIAILQPAARGPEANAKTRQNLALSYALAGRWLEARTIAAQDLPMTTVDRRMAEWAAFARPTAAWDQVASLLGVTPAYDAGQPVALALAPVNTAPVAVAAADPVAETVAPAVAEAPVEIASVNTAPETFGAEPVVAESIVAEPAAAASVASASGVVFGPLSPVVQAVPEQPTRVASPQRQKRAEAPLIRSDRAPSKRQVIVSAAPAAAVASKPILSSSASTRFSVQLGAFSNAANANTAWTKATKSNAGLSRYNRASSRVTVNKASLYRLAVTGFTSREDANRVCAKVQSSGGSCFVRAAGGDTNIRFAQKGIGTKVAVRRNTNGTKIASR